MLAEAVQGSPPAALHMSEGALLAELAILEYLLHQSIALRLEFLHPVDPLLAAAERTAALRRAHYYCEIIQKMLRALKLAFPDGELPFDDSLQRRMAWAKFVGLALFFRRNSACWDGEERDEGDIQEGFLAAIPLFKETMAGLDSANNSSTTLMAVEMATQFWTINHVSGRSKVDRAAQSASVAEVAALLGSDKFELLRSSLDTMYEALLAALAKGHDLGQKFPYAVFSRHLTNFLRNVYQDIEAPIIARFCQGTGSSEEEGAALETQMPPPGLPSQFNVMTQPPNVLLASSSPAAAAATTTATASGRGSSTTSRKRDPAHNTPLRAATLQEPALPPPPPPSSSQSLHLGLGSQSQSQSFCDPLPWVVQSGGGVAATDGSTCPLKRPLTSSAWLAEGIPQELSEFCRDLQALPAHVFRQCLCNDDDLLASIMERADLQVREFLKRSKIRSPAPSSLPCHGRVSSSGSSSVEMTAIPPKHSKMLLARHDSAERIDWLSLPPSPAKVLAQGPTTSPATATATPGSMASRRRPWSEDEVNHLIEGYRRFGPNWAHILKQYKFVDRTNVNLKDKARHLLRIGRL